MKHLNRLFLYLELIQTRWTQRRQISYHNFDPISIMKIQSKYLLVKFSVMIYLLYALLLRFWYYRVMSYYSCWYNTVISVSGNFASAFPDYGAGKNGVHYYSCLLTWGAQPRPWHSTIDDVGLALDLGVGCGRAFYSSRPVCLRMKSWRIVW